MVKNCLERSWGGWAGRVVRLCGCECFQNPSSGEINHGCFAYRSSPVLRVDRRSRTALLAGMPVDFAALERRCVEKLSAHAGDAAHDLEHVRRVVRNAAALARVEKARLEIVLPAAWLHDCVSVPKDSPQRASASRLAAGQAGEWLRE